MDAIFLSHAWLPSGWAHDVAIDIQDGTILAVAPHSCPDGRKVFGGLALPGLPNLHSHAFQRAMAGLAERRGPEGDSFWTWREVMYRFLQRLTPDDVEAIAALAYSEMLEAGFTAVAEFHYLHNDEDGRPYSDPAEMSGRIAAAAATAEIGLTLLPSFYAHSTFGGAPPTEGQRRFINEAESFLKLVDQARGLLKGLPDARLGAAPHSLRAVTPELLREVVSAFPDGPIHIHAAEQVKEVEDCLAWSGRRPVQWLLDEIGLVERWCVIHATHMLPEETAALARSGAVAGLCPLTEASLGDGIFDGAAFMEGGGRYGVGTDSNVEITAPGELKQLEYAQRLAKRARNVMAPRAGASTGEALYRAALGGGAQACGRSIGAIAPGCRADLVLLDENDVDLQGVAPDLRLDRTIFVAGRRAVKTVLVGGRVVVEDGRHIHRDAIRARYLAVLPRLLG